VLLACTGAALSLGAVAGAASGQSPSFAAPRVLAASLDPDALAIGDLNGDGRLDLAIDNSYFDAEEGEGGSILGHVHVGKRRSLIRG
jgi:FG-GAP repeat protein